MWPLCLFLISRCVFIVIWVSWKMSCGGFGGGIIIRSTYRACTPELYYLLMSLIGLGRISRGWRVYLCIASLYHLLRIYWLPLFGQHLHLWCCGHSQLWGSVPIYVEPLCTLISPIWLCWDPDFLNCGFLSVVWLLGMIYLWLILLTTGVIGTFFEWFTILFIYPNGIWIVLKYHTGHIIMIHSPVRSTVGN